MLSFVTLALALSGFATGVVSTSELSARADGKITDTTILQYALTLEHLEDTFYHQALAKFDAAAFRRAGFPSWVRGRFEQIAAHEASHVKFLTTALGKDAVPACEYKFPYTDPQSFASFSQAVEGLGTSAYLGAAALISNPAYLTAAGSILTVEARHDAWVASAVKGGAAWNLPYDTPLGLSGVYSIASQFITKCPDNYPALPVTTYPALTVGTSTPTPGGALSVTFDNKANVKNTYLAFYSGLNTYAVNVNGSSVTVPAELANSGTVYAAVVSNNTGDAASTLSGLAILSFPFKSDVVQAL